MPIPTRATVEATIKPAVPSIQPRTSRPAAARPMASTTVRSRPSRCTTAGVAIPSTAKAAVGSIPSTPAAREPKPSSPPTSSSSGVREVMAVRRLNAASAMPASTRSRPRQGKGVVIRQCYRRRGESAERGAHHVRRGGAEVLLQVLLALVAEQRHHAAQLWMLLAHAPPRHQVRAGTGAAQQPVLARPPAQLGDGLVVGYRQVVADQLGVAGEDAADESVGDPLDGVRVYLPAQDRPRSGGLHREQPHVRVDLAERLPDA